MWKDRFCNNNNNINNNSSFILGNNVQLNQHKTKIKLLHINKYIKPSYLGTDQYRVKRLDVNKFFGELIKAEWVSAIKLDKQREAELQSCFDCQLDFYYPRNKEQFDNLLEYFKTKSNSTDPDDAHSDKDFSVSSINYGENYGEKSNRNRLIVTDNVSGLADTSSKFASFLQLQGNLNIIACTFSTQFILTKVFGRQYCHKRIC